MPILKPCKCGKLISSMDKFCDICAVKANQNKRNDNHCYDVSIRQSQDNKKYYDFYNGDDWEQLRVNVLNYYNDLDIYAYYTYDIIVLANTAHHIEEIKDNWDKRYTFDNMFPCSGNSHASIHKLYKCDKIGTQKLLIDMLNRYKNEFKKQEGGGQKKLT